MLGCSALLSVAFATNSVEATEAGQVTSAGRIDFLPSDLPTPPVDPENPSIEVDPGEVVATNGPLRLDFIPKLSFGRRLISDQDQTYNVLAQQFVSDTPTRPNYLQLTDNRWTLSGWELTVKQEKQFFSGEATHAKELKGAVLSFDKQSIHSAYDLEGYVPTLVEGKVALNEMGASYSIATAKENNGPGTWVIKFGSSNDVGDEKGTLIPIKGGDGKARMDETYNKPMYENTGIQLSVPGSIEKEAVNYGTVLTWTLSELT